MNTKLQDVVKEAMNKAQKNPPKKGAAGEILLENLGSLTSTEINNFKMMRIFSNWLADQIKDTSDLNPETRLLVHLRLFHLIRELFGVIGVIFWDRVRNRLKIRSNIMLSVDEETWTLWTSCNPK